MNAMATRAPNPIPRNSGAGRHPFTPVLKTYPNGSNHIMSDRLTALGHSDSCRLIWPRRTDSHRRIGLFRFNSHRLTSPDRSRLCLLEATGRPGSLRSPVPETSCAVLLPIVSRRRTEFGSSRSLSGRLAAFTRDASYRRIVLESSRSESDRHAALCPVESRRQATPRPVVSSRRTSLFRVVFESGRQAYSCRDRSSPVTETYQAGSARFSSGRQIGPLLFPSRSRDKSSHVLLGRILETYRALSHPITSHRPAISACVGSRRVDKPGLPPSCPGDCSTSVKSVLVGETNLPRSLPVLETFRFGSSRIDETNHPVLYSIDFLPFAETNWLKLRRILETDLLCPRPTRGDVPSRDHLIRGDVSC